MALSRSDVRGHACLGACRAGRVQSPPGLCPQDALVALRLAVYRPHTVLLGLHSVVSSPDPAVSPSPRPKYMPFLIYSCWSWRVKLVFVSDAWCEGHPGGLVGEASDSAHVMISRLVESEPQVGLCADGSEPGARFGFCVSLCPCPCPAHALSRSVSQK